MLLWYYLCTNLIQDHQPAEAIVKNASPQLPARPKAPVQEQQKGEDEEDEIIFVKIVRPSDPGYGKTSHGSVKRQPTETPSTAFKSKNKGTDATPSPLPYEIKNLPDAGLQTCSPGSIAPPLIFPRVIVTSPSPSASKAATPAETATPTPGLLAVPAQPSEVSTATGAQHHHGHKGPREHKTSGKATRGRGAPSKPDSVATLTRGEGSDSKRSRDSEDEVSVEAYGCLPPKLKRMKPSTSSS